MPQCLEEKEMQLKNDSTSLDTRLLMLARAGWLLVAALCLTTFAFSIPVSFVQSEHACSGENCSQPYLTQHDIQALAHVVFPTFFAAYFMALSIGLCWSGSGWVR